jgi:ligand-binding sensor domain-containing protein
MNIRVKIFFTVLLFLFSRKTADAQVPFFKTFQVDKENNELRVQRILRDHAGFLWLGTSEGLYKFNGIDFSKVRSELIADQSVTALYEDRRQRLWVGCKSGKIIIVERNNVKSFLPEKKSPGSAIHDILEDSESRIWFATNGEGVYYFEHDSLHNIRSDNGLNDDFTYSLALTKDGAIWIGTDQGIGICRMNNGVSRISKLTSADGLPDNIVRILLPDSSQDIWIGMQDKGVCKYVAGKKTFFTPKSLQDWRYGQVNCIMQSGNHLWIGTDQYGIVNFENAQDGNIRQLSAGDNIKLSKINDLVEDPEFNVWIANNNLLVRSSGEQINFLLNDENKKTDGTGNDNKTSSFRFIHSILSDHAGNLWFTPDQGLVKYNLAAAAGNNITRYTITPVHTLVDISALHEDEHGYLWIGTMGDGIFRMNIKTGKFTKVKGESSIEKASVLSIAVKDDFLWFAGLEGVSKCKIEDGETNHASLHFADVSATHSFGRNYIYCIFIDSKNRVWLGTDDKGIIVYDQGKYTTYSASNGLRSNVIYSITEDPSGNIWFSTLNAGIYKFDGKKFHNYTTDDGLSDLNIFSIASDSYGNIVIVNKHGIDVLDPATGLFTYFDRSSGINELNSDLNAITKDNSGNIWIGTESGIIKYHSRKLTQAFQPITVLNRVSVFLDEVDFRNASKFSYDQNNFTFDYNGLWYSDPERVKYQYMLEGYNNTWINSRDRSIIYPKLAPGTYTFKIRSSLNQNFNNASEASYKFIIASPFWFRWWFLALVALVISFSLRHYIMNRERRIKHMDLLQKEKIEFQFETLKNQVNPHFLFNSFNTLISIIEENPKIAVEYVERLSQFFRNIVMYREKDVILLKEELELLDNYYFLQKKRFCENLSLNMDIPEEIKNSRYVPPLTLQLLMENTVKHNSVSRETPLTIDVFINKYGKLVMRNNKNIKIKKAESPGIGLQNIVSRFQLLSDRTVEIKDGDDFFEVAIPLIKVE